MGNYIQSSSKFSQINFFQSVDFFFTREISSRRLRGTRLPMSLGSFASFRRIVPCRDTSTTESEIPSFRDAAPHESWELVPLDELSLAGILQLWNRRFQVSGMQSHSNSYGLLVIASKAKQSLLAFRYCEVLAYP